MVVGQKMRRALRAYSIKKAPTVKPPGVQGGQKAQEPMFKVR